MKAFSSTHRITMLLPICALLIGIFTFNSAPAYASTNMTDKGQTIAHTSSIKIANTDCVLADESDNGWGITQTSLGARLNLNGVFFGAQNDCNLDVTNGFWTITDHYTCQEKPFNGSFNGSFSGIPAGDFLHIVSSTIVLQCNVYTDGKLTSIYPPETAFVNFNVRANLSGGTSSSDTAVVKY
jgi:hypothetical protein